jgi:TRAP-type uncharacterized transport system fused permease subunit
MIIYCPLLILEPQGSVMVALLKLLALIIAILCIQVGINNYYIVLCHPFERALSFLGAALLFLGTPFQGYPLFALFALGASSFILLTVNQLRRRRFTAGAPLRQEIKDPVPNV